MSDPFNAGIPNSSLTQTSSGVDTIRQQFPIQDVILRTITAELAALKQTAQIEALIKEVQLLQQLTSTLNKPQVTAKPQLDVQLPQQPISQPVPVQPRPGAQQPTVPQTPTPSSSGKEKIYQVILSTVMGDLKLEIPSKLPLEAGQKFSIELKPGLPLTLSKLVLLNDLGTKNNLPNITQQSPLTSSITPVFTPSTTPLANAKPLQVGGMIEAFLLPHLKATNTAEQNPLAKNTLNQSLLENLKQNGFILQNLSAIKTPNAIQSSEKMIIKIIHFSSPSGQGAQTSGFIPSTPPQAQVDLSGIHINTQKPLNVNSPIMTGTVVGKTAQNAPILMTDIGQLFILSNTNLKEGAKVTFQMMAPEASSPALKPSVLPSLPPSNFSFDTWPVMDDLMSVFSASPENAAQLQNILPTTSRQLPTLLLFFLAAVKTGDATPASLWMGQQIQQNLKETGKQNLIDQLNTDFRAISKTVKEQKSGLEFRSTIVPFQQDQQIQPIQLLVRHQHTQSSHDEKQNKDDQQEIKPRNVRFLVNLNLSRLGKTQIDGYLKNKNMDMILRLERKMPDHLSNAIINRYGEVLETLGLKGKVSFQGMKDWVYFDSVPDEDLEMNI